MPAPDPALPEAGPWSQPIRDLGLSIAGSALEPIVAEIEAERLNAGLQRLRPRYYLSTEWGVVEGTVGIAIPFYLASPELTALQAERVGHVEGTGDRRVPVTSPFAGRVMRVVAWPGERVFTHDRIAWMRAA